MTGAAVGYREVYDGWKADPEGFWLHAAEAIDWIRAPTRALDDSRAPLYGWFADAVRQLPWCSASLSSASRMGSHRSTASLSAGAAGLGTKPNEPVLQ